MAKQKRTAGFGEISQFVNRPRPKAFRINIIQFPAGTWGYVGSIPFALTKEDKTSLVVGGSRRTLSFATRKEAVTTARKAGFKEGTLYSLETGKEFKEQSSHVLPKRKSVRITPKTPRLRK